MCKRSMGVETNVGGLLFEDLVLVYHCRSSPPCVIVLFPLKGNGRNFELILSRK